MEKNILKMITDTPIKNYEITDKYAIVNDSIFIPVELYNMTKDIYIDTYSNKISESITGDILLFINSYELMYFSKQYIIGLIKRLNYSELKPTIIIDRFIPKVQKDLIDAMSDTNYELYYHHSELEISNSIDIMDYRKDIIINLYEEYNKPFIICSYSDIIISNEIYDFNMYLYLKNINGTITDPVYFSYSVCGTNEYFFDKMFCTNIMKNIILLSDEKIILSDYLLEHSNIYDYCMLDTYNDNDANLLVINYDRANINKMKKIFEIADIVGFNIIVYYNNTARAIVESNIRKISGNYVKYKLVGKDNFYNLICEINNKSIIIDSTRNCSLIELLVEKYSLKDSLSYFTISNINDKNKYQSLNLDDSTISLIKTFISISYNMPNIQYDPISIQNILN